MDPARTTAVNTGELSLYSGHEDEDAPHAEGVALLLRKEAQKALVGCEARGSRIITACFKTKNRKIKMNIKNTIFRLVML